MINGAQINSTQINSKSTSDAPLAWTEDIAVAPAEIIVSVTMTFTVSVPGFVPRATVYRCILTGEEDDTTDLILPIKSFQARLRSGTPTYCGVVVPDIDSYIDDIKDRLNGQLVVSIGQKWFSGNVNWKELVRVNFEDLSYNKGGRNSSAQLSGHITTTSSSSNTVAAIGVQVESLQKDGKHRIRCEVDWNVRPGDTITWNDDNDSMIVGLITIAVGNRLSRMEVTEAA